MPSKTQVSVIKGPQYEVIPRRLHKLFEDKVLENPNKTALIYNDKVLTRVQVNERSNQYARVFLREALENSLKPNQDGDNIIAVCMEPSDNLVIVLLAIWKAGFAYIAIDPILTANRIAHILNEARPMMVICDNDMDRNLFGSSLTLSINELNEKAVPMDVINIPDDQMIKATQDLAIVLYTSGSTGVPKGVKLPPIALLNRLKWQWITFPFTDETVGVFKTSLAFVDSVLEIWSTLLYGLTLLVVPKPTTKDPAKLVKLLDEYQIGRIMLVPTLLRNIIMYLQMERKTHNNNDRLLSKLKNWVCSGEPLQKQLAQQFFDYFEEGKHFLHNFYGCTEVMGDVIYFTCRSKQQLNEFEKIPIGLPVANTEIYILDEDYRPVSHGEIGEIFASGLPLANGYVNGRDPGRFFDSPLAIEGKFSRLYNTGDFGTFRKGYIHFEGRLDSQIKIRGHRVDLTEVEKTILSFDFVEKVIVLCHQGDPIDRTLLAFVQFNDLSPRYSELEIEKALKKKLQDYMIPQVIIVHHFPLLVNGKIDRQELLRSYESKRNDVIAMDFSQVSDDLKVIARDVFNIIGSVIGRSARGTLTVESNFYKMGGNSLNSIIAVTLLREKGYHIEISEFISAKNVGEVLRIVSNKPYKLTEGDFKLAHLNMKAFPLTEGDKETAIKILAESFYDKGDLEYWIKEDISLQDYFDLFEDMWEDALNKGYSFIVKNMDTKETIGVVINYDARDEPECHMKANVDKAFYIVKELEGPFRENQMPMEINKVFCSAYSVTSGNLNPQENIACMYFMEEEVINLAKRKNFMAILTTNSNPLTQQIGNVFKYKCLVDYQVNQYIYKDGTRPFALAPDSQRIMVHYKEL